MFECGEIVYVVCDWGYSGWFEIIDHDLGMPGDRDYEGKNSDYPNGFLFTDDDIRDAA